MQSYSWMLNANLLQGNFLLTFFYITGLASLAMNNIKSSPLISTYVSSLWNVLNVDMSSYNYVIVSVIETRP